MPRKAAVGLDVATHARNFFDCVKSRAKPAANSQVMRHSHIACHAAALSWILKRKLKFDPVKEEFIGDDEANGLRFRPQRPPGSYRFGEGDMSMFSADRFAAKRTLSPKDGSATAGIHRLGAFHGRLIFVRARARG